MSISAIIMANLYSVYTLIVHILYFVVHTHVCLYLKFIVDHYLYIDLILNH